MSTELLTPVGRLVRGNLYEPQTTDLDGKPLITRTGPNAGQARVSYFFALAIPKGTETHWSQTEWGAKIWAVGAAAFPASYQAPAFAWKITDGDDASEFNSQGKPRKVKPCDREGHARHWILHFASGMAPSIHSLINVKKPIDLPELKAINPGDYVQVYGSVSDNGSQQQPGVYLNHRMVCLMGYGERIILGISAEDVGFGGAVPPGASAVPVAAYNPPAPVAVQPAYAAPVAAAAPVVEPYRPILNPPAPPVPVAVAVPPPAAPRVLKVQATYNPGGTALYDDFIKAGWTDAQLTQHGLI